MEIKQEQKEVRLEAFRKECPNCGQTFRVLKLPDFEYGRRVFYTEDGQDYALAEVAEDENYKEIVGLVKSLCPSENMPEVEVLDCFDQIYGEICDPVNGKKLDAQGGIFVCPHCQSEEADIFDIDPPEYEKVQVPLVTYSGWRQKNEVGKRETISRLLEEKGCCC
jgi:Zn finger protein HypA/HybF involved in hydrogenase expression